MTWQPANIPQMDSPTRTPLALFVAAALAVVLHAGVTAAALGPSLVSGARPGFGDHWIHYYRAVADARIAEATGDRVGYDPQILAGAPHGAIDTNSPGLSAVTLRLGGLLGTARAYALVMVLATLLTPWRSPWRAERLARRPRTPPGRRSPRSPSSTWTRSPAAWPATA